MRIALVWQAKGDPRKAPDPTAVLRKLEESFGSLFKKPPRSELCSTPHGHLALLELPVAGWNRPFFERMGDDFAFAPDPPVFATSSEPEALARAGDSGQLLALGRELQRDPAGVLRDICPPFSLVWNDAARGELLLQNDGLGQSPWSEYEDGEIWAATNRISALTALGVPLRVNPEEWAVRFTLGWFPMQLSGYERVRALLPGARIRLGAAGVKRETVNVLRDWVHPPARSEEECLEHASASFTNVLRNASACWSKATVGLSGGWDSRAAASVLRTLGASFELRVRGHPERLDVKIANQLARIAELPIRIKHQSGVPPEELAGLRASLSNALLWQAGHMTTLKHKTFLVRKPVMDGGVVNVMGQHSGIGKADFAVKIKAHELDPQEYEGELLRSLMEDAPPILNEKVRSRVQDMIVETYRQAAPYDLDGLHALHFFFLYEYTRRWGAATVNAQTGLVVTPFLNPGFIEAAYAFPPEKLPERPFHKRITGQNAPDWAAYPYESQITVAQARSDYLPPADLVINEETDLPKWRQGRKWGKYDQTMYWEMVGRPLVQEAIDAEGWWTEIFDRDKVEDTWRKKKGVADTVVIAHLLGE